MPTDNARIVERALYAAYLKGVDTSSASTALTALETELATAKEEARINLESAHAESVDRDAMLRRTQKAETELSDLKAELARAREEERERCVIKATEWAKANSHDPECIALEVNSAWFECSLRAALAPEQKEKS